MSDFLYFINDKSYPVYVTYKNINNIYFRYKNDSFYISCPPIVNKKTLISGLDKYADKLIAKAKGNTQIKNDKIYFLGEQFPLLNKGQFILKNKDVICFKNKEERDLKLRQYFAQYVNKRLRELSKIMSVNFAKVMLKDMTSRYGSYSKRSKNISISYNLLPYEIEIVDSVLIHELSHILVFNHSKYFYDVVYKYCPNYDKLSKKLKKGIYR